MEGGIYRSRGSLNHKIQTYSGPFSFGYLVGRREVVLPWRWWLELRVVVLGFSKGRGFAASFFSTTPRPPLKGALVALLRRGVVKIEPMALLF